MARPTLDRIWASGDDSQIKDPGDAKYRAGWEAEIPTYQILNFLQNKADHTLLSLGERGVFEWGSDIIYKAGSLAWDEAVGKVYVSMVDAPNPTLPPSQSLSQWELSSVQLTRTEFDALNADITNHVGQLGTTNPHQLQPHDVDTYSRAEIDAMVDEEHAINAAHIADTNNPHATTAAQAGGVNKTGGEYTGPVTMGSGVTNLNTDGTATLDTTNGFLGVLVGDSGMGVDGTGQPGKVVDGVFTSFDLMYVKKSGDIITGRLEFKPADGTNTGAIPIIEGWTDGPNNYGAHLGITSEGGVGIASGSSAASAIKSALVNTESEDVHIGADSNVYLLTSGGTKKWALKVDGSTSVPGEIFVGENQVYHEGFPPPPPPPLDMLAIMDAMMPVGTLHPSTNPANPATYFGFGTWEARPGLLAGVGSCTDTAGKTGAYAAGYNGGFWRVQSGHIVAATFNLANGYANGNGDHAHHLEINTQGGGTHQHDIGIAATGDGGDGNDDGATYMRQEGLSYTGWAADHIHLVTGDTWGAGLHDHSVTGSVTIGDGDVLTGSAFFNPYFGAYIWERTA